MLRGGVGVKVGRGEIAFLRARELGDGAGVGIMTARFRPCQSYSRKTS